MFALVDCNNFFVSCERAVNPGLNGRPVIVLSGGDGCVVAMSNEAKAVGITRGIPMFRIRDIVKRHGVVAIRGHHRLYKETSLRVMAVLSSLVEKIEIYSIDEAFLHIPPSTGDMAGFGRYVAAEVMRLTSIPVSVGLAPTKTLAKIAAGFAKKYPGYRGACLMDTGEKRIRALSLTPIGKVWGIGPRLSVRLGKNGITTALDFASMPRASVAAIVSVAGERTWRELNGEPCIEHEYVPPERRSISSTATFDHDVTDFDRLRSALADHVATAASRMRRKAMHAGEISVFIQTNRYKPHLPQTSDTARFTFDPPTADTLALTAAAAALLGQIYKKGFAYKRSGVTLDHLVGDDKVQHGLFEDIGEVERRRRLMDTLDRLNSTPGTISLGSQGRN